MVTLIGMGSGKWEALSAQAQQAVRSAGLVFGAKRLLVGLPPECTARQFALYQPADILETLAQNSGQDAAVLYSGDTGFYSGASGLLTPLRALGIPARVYPGVSSIQLLSAALGRPWQDWKLVSAHGTRCDPVAAVLEGREAFFLTGGELGLSVPEADRCRYGRNPRRGGRKPWHRGGSHPLRLCCRAGGAELCTAQRASCGKL